MRIMVTGAAGFIGFHTAMKLTERGHAVLGVDNLNDYYDKALKQARLDILLKRTGFEFVLLDLADRMAVPKLFAGEPPAPLTPSLSHGERGQKARQMRFDSVIHLAAQAGVRYSLTNPHAYVDANLQAFVNVLEGCRHNGISHLVYASSSSVYGGNTKLPFSETDRVDTPVSLYAATKKANELMAYTYSHLYGLRTTGLRFFTVYGPWGRPDMAMFIFTRAITEGKQIDVYGHGEMWRDFTYVDDIVDGILRIVEGRRHSGPGQAEDADPIAEQPPASREARTGKPKTGIAGDSLTPALSQGEREETRAPLPAAGIYNIGHNKPEHLMDLIRILENELGKKALVRFLPMQQGDVPKTYADIDALHRDFGFEPKTALKEGVKRFVEWYREYSGQVGAVHPGTAGGKQGVSEPFVEFEKEPRKALRVYVDTSVFGGVFDEEFKKASIEFFEMVQAGFLKVLISEQTESEISEAPERVRAFVVALPESCIEHIMMDESTAELALKYVEKGVLPEKSMGDAMHVACATVSGAKLILSWNFKHLVRYDRILAFNKVNRESGYQNIDIRSPLEIRREEDEEI